jgi:hypothetical protein
MAKIGSGREQKNRHSFADRLFSTSYEMAARLLLESTRNASANEQKTTLRGRDEK